MVAEEDGRYIYGVLDCAEALNLGRIGIGDCRNEVRCCKVGDISALVSLSPVVKYSISRENLLIHQRVLEEAMRSYTVLPVRFCTIAEEEAQITKVFEKRYDEFKKLLVKMKGRSEIGLKALWTDMSGIFNEIVEENQQIRKMKKQLEKPGLSKSKEYSIRVAIGEMVKHALDEKKERESDQLLRDLKPLAGELKKNTCHGDSMFLNAAFLADREEEKKMDQRLERLAADLDGRVKIKYVGPVPIFNFVEIVIHWE